ncbi:MAG TPA: hypothetical protein VGF01_10895 [Terracidiphilus sp.]
MLGHGGVGTEVLQNIIDGIFKARTSLVGGFDPLGYHLADFKSVHAVREGTVNLVGTHDFTPVNGGCCVRCGARQKQ